MRTVSSGSLAKPRKVTVATESLAGNAESSTLAARVSVSAFNKRSAASRSMVPAIDAGLVAGLVAGFKS